MAKLRLTYGTRTPAQLQRGRPRPDRGQDRPGRRHDGRAGQGGGEPCVVLLFTDGTRHGFVLPGDGKDGRVSGRTGMKARLYLDVEFDEKRTDAESLAAALDRLLKTALSTPGIMDEYGGSRGPASSSCWTRGGLPNSPRKWTPSSMDGRTTSWGSRSFPFGTSFGTLPWAVRMYRKPEAKIAASFDDLYRGGHAWLTVFRGDHDRRQGSCRPGRGIREGSRRDQGVRGRLRRLSLRPQAAAA